MPVLRIIDANANRAREALRVMEEAARFLLDDEALARELKMLRHALSAAIAGLGPVEAWRDTPGDVGCEITAPAEGTRRDAADVVRAAGKRLSEALRVLEEYGKTIDPAVAAKMERMRYVGYDLEQRLDLALGPAAPRQWRVCVLLTESLCRRHAWADVAQAAVEAGADCIQLREKTLDDAGLLARAQRLVAIARGRAAVVVNDRPDVALLAGADGVHLGQGDLPADAVRSTVGRRLVIGVSTSRIVEAERALALGADYCGVGPMFPTGTKHKETLAGPAYLREYARWGRLPHLAIGGITPDNVERLVEVGARGIALSAAVCGADDPGAVVRRLVDALGKGARVGNSAADAIDASTTETLRTAGRAAKSHPSPRGPRGA